MIVLGRKLLGKFLETLLKCQDSADSVIEVVITKDRQKVLLVVTCQIDWVLGEITTGRRGKKLREMKSGLSGPYTAILGITKGEQCS